LGKGVLAAKFWLRVDARSAPKECWPWTGGGDKRGYGQLNWPVMGRWVRLKAHRVAFALWNDVDVSTVALLRHTCNRPSCCNPLHLVPGTQSENMEDARAAGTMIVGEAHKLAKLTGELVRAARDAAARGESVGALAGAIGVSAGTLHKAVRRETWKHIK
jgi:hypothetical protein